MQHFYNQLKSPSNQFAYWKSLSELRLFTLDVITSSNSFLAWNVW